jgi:tryptophan 2-monooxygenase
MAYNRGIVDRLSVQYFVSNYHNGTGIFACCGGSPAWFAEFYTNKKMAIPWSNANASFSDGCTHCGQSTNVLAQSITTVPNYPLESVTALIVPTRLTDDGTDNMTAIENIKGVLHSNKAVILNYALDDWGPFMNFWDSHSEEDIWTPKMGTSYTNGLDPGSHTVLCLGYNDTDPKNRYWIVLNSWGAPENRPHGLFHLSMDLNYSYVYQEGINGYSWYAFDVKYPKSLRDEKSEPIVLICGNLWDGKTDGLLGPAEILVKDGIVAEMGKNVTRPADAMVYDLSNQTVMPGFIDCHVHLTYFPENFALMFTESQSMTLLHALEPLKILLMNGFTTVRDLGTETKWNFVTVDMKHAIDKGLIVGPRMIVGPHIISSTGGHGDKSGMVSPELYNALRSTAVADGPDEIQMVVREEVRGGADWIKFAATGGFASPTSDPGKATYTQDEMNILVATAHDLGVPVCAHDYGDEGVKRAVIAGVDSIEHGNMASLEALKMIEEREIFLVPTQYALQSDADNINNSSYWMSMPPWEYQKMKIYAPSIKASQKNLAASKVKIAFGTDAGLFPTKDNWKEFPTMVQNGISPLRALKAATSTAAELLRKPELGTLAVGQAADIIAMPGDPFQDINVTGKVDFVMKAGIVYKF